MATKVGEDCCRTETFGHLGFPCHQIKISFLQNIMQLLIYSGIPMLKDESQVCLPSRASPMAIGEWQEADAR